MVTGWHVAHLPVRVSEEARPFQSVQEVVVSWSDFSIAGVLLTPRPFRVPFVPKGRFRMTALGVIVQERASVVHPDRSWLAAQRRADRLFLHRSVVDEQDRLLGRLKDVLIDENRLVVTHLVVSRGILGDLLVGSWIVPREAVVAHRAGVIKITSDRAFLSKE